MGYNAAPLEKLIEEFGKFPGIGRKGATRMAYQVLSMSDEDAACLLYTSQAFSLAVRVTLRRARSGCTARSRAMASSAAACVVLRAVR